MFVIFTLTTKKSELDSITVITSSEKDASVKQIMHEAGFQLTHKDNYSKTSFCTFKPNRDVTVEEIKELFASVRKTVTAEVQHKLKKQDRFIDYLLAKLISGLFLLVKKV